MHTSDDFDSWAERFAADWVRLNPLAATMTQYFRGNEQDALDRKLSLTSPFCLTFGKRVAEERAALARRGLKELRDFEEQLLSAEQQTSAAIIAWRLQDAIANAPFAQHRFIFTQMVGLHVGLVHFLTTMHPLRNERDGENYIARLNVLPHCLDEGIEEARDAAEHGFIPPRSILERTIEQLDGLTAEEAAVHTFVRSLRDRLGNVGAISRSGIDALCSAATHEVAKNVLPALLRIRTMLVEQLPKANEHDGAWSLPDGDVYYRRQLATLAGTPLSPKEIHDIGRSQVALIEAEMDALLRELGYIGGKIAERIKALNETLLSRGDGDARDVILMQLQQIVDDASRRSEANFNLRPNAPVIVQREPEFSERTAGAHYTPPAPDGSLPGTYWVSLADIGPKVPWLGVGMRSTAYHEAIPGHHFQLTIEQEADTLPRFRRLRAFDFDPAYGEGWALYAEHLAAENGWYEGDIPSRVGYLAMQAVRAHRLVMDTGLHAFKWPRQQGIDYGGRVVEVERYISWPGQACSYMLGQRKILEMRQRAAAALGGRFAIKGFHDPISGGGTMPLDVLERRVDAWVRQHREG